MKFPSLGRLETRALLVSMSVTMFMLTYGLFDGDLEESLVWALSPWVGYVFGKLGP